MATTKTKEVKLSKNEWIGIGIGVVAIAVIAYSIKKRKDAYEKKFGYRPSYIRNLMTNA